MQISASIVVEGDVQRLINSLPQDPFVHKDNHAQFAAALTLPILQHTLDSHLKEVAQGKSLRIKRLYEKLVETVSVDTKYNLAPESGPRRSDAYTQSIGQLLETFPWETYLQKENDAFAPYTHFIELFKVFEQFSFHYYNHLALKPHSFNSAKDALAFERTVRWAQEKELGLFQGEYCLKKLYDFDAEGKRVEKPTKRYGLTAQVPTNVTDQIIQTYSWPHGSHLFGIPDREPWLTDPNKLFVSPDYP